MQKSSDERDEGATVIICNNSWTHRIGGNIHKNRSPESRDFYLLKKIYIFSRCVVGCLGGGTRLSMTYKSCQTNWPFTPFLFPLFIQFFFFLLLNSSEKNEGEKGSFHFIFRETTATNHNNIKKKMTAAVSRGVYVPFFSPFLRKSHQNDTPT